MDLINSVELLVQFSSVLIAQQTVVDIEITVTVILVLELQLKEVKKLFCDYLASLRRINLHSPSTECSS